jgi:hypothetical protein
MADWATIASVGTAAGTMVLGVATFASVRSAQRAARVAERSLLVGLRPVLMPSRPDDPTERVMWGDGFSMNLAPGTVRIEEREGIIYLAMALRNVGPGLAVLRGWHLGPLEGWAAAQPREDLESFRLLQRDLYIPAGDTGIWQGVVRDAEGPLRQQVADSLTGGRLKLELFYGDHEGGQPTVSRFFVERQPGGDDWLASASRHWILEPDAARFLQH